MHNREPASLFSVPAENADEPTGPTIWAAGEIDDDERDSARMWGWVLLLGIGIWVAILVKVLWMVLA